jgi:DNA-directed RNA polymerase subunit RPC12/RpoP
MEASRRTILEIGAGPETQAGATFRRHQQALRTSMSTNRDNLEHCLGYIRTHFDCPHCNFDFNEEGDKSSEVIECPSCQEKFWCREVR